MATLEETAEMHQRVNTGSERTVQPTTTLRDELRRRFRYISFSLGGFDIGKMPFRTSLGDQFEAENTIFGQEHVLLENAHTVDTLWSQDFGESMITVEILFKRPAHDGAVTVCRESTRQHTDVTKGTLQRLVQDVTDLVLEVLACNERVEEVLPATT